MALVTFDDRELVGQGDNASNFVWCKPSADIAAGWVSNWTVILSRGTGFSNDGTNITCNKNGTVKVSVIIDNMNGSTQQDKSVVIYKNGTAVSQGYEYGAYSACISAQAVLNVVVGDVIKIATSTGTTKQQFSTLLCEYINEYYLISYANTNNSYSTNEIATGGVWIDGKPIYRKVWTGSVSSGTSGTAVSNVISSLNIDTVVNIKSMAKDNDGRRLSAYYWSSTDAFRIYISGGSLMWNVGSSYPVKPFTYHIIMEYTKATD